MIAATGLVGALLLCLGTPAAANAKAGEKKAEICAMCHGPRNTQAFMPMLDGQTREYLVAQLKAYKEYRRHDPAMQTNAASLSERDMRDIAEYFAARKPIRWTGTVDPGSVADGRAKAQALQCSGCHKPDFSGDKAVPRLAGNRPRYLALQITHIARQKRPHPEVPGFSGLGDADAENLGLYFATLE